MVKLPLVLLEEAGYKTALAGKWQMALLKKYPKHVAQIGSEESCLTWHEGPRNWKPMIYRNDKVINGIAEKYGPDVFTDFLKSFIRSNKEGRFFYCGVLPQTRDQNPEIFLNSPVRYC